MRCPPCTYTMLAEFIARGRSKRDRPLGYATRAVRRSDTSIAIRHWHTDILTFHACGDVDVYAYSSLTSAQRLRHYADVSRSASRGDGTVRGVYYRVLPERFSIVPRVRAFDVVSTRGVHLKAVNATYNSTRAHAIYACARLAEHAHACGIPTPHVLLGRPANGWRCCGRPWCEHARAARSFLDSQAGALSFLIVALGDAWDRSVSVELMRDAIGD